jgi:hypothetical protein
LEELSVILGAVVIIVSLVDIYIKWKQYKVWEKMEKNHHKKYRASDWGGLE